MLKQITVKTDRYAHLFGHCRIRSWSYAQVLPAALTAARLQQDANLAEQKAARERFDSLKAAYEVLRNPETRRQYDQGNPVRPV